MVPKIGDIIYIPSSLYIGHGKDDVEGGLATISKIKNGISGGKKVNFVSVREVPNNSYNWDQYLEGMQSKLKERYKDQIAHPDPDYGGN